MQVLTVGEVSGETTILGRDITQNSVLSRHLLLILAGRGAASAIGVAVLAVALSIAPLRRVRDFSGRAGRLRTGTLRG